MSTTRRNFLQAGSATTMLAAAAPAQTPKGANDKINVACIGFGIMGQGDVSTVTTVPGAKLVAVADVYEGRRTKAKEGYGKDIFTTADYREILARPDVDAVIVATPDHWHQIIACDAMRAGKDVYCQKPMVQKVEEGAAVIQAEKETKRILQVGSQRASSILYAKAREVIKQGSIGEVRMVEAFWDRNSALGAWQYSVPPDATPQTLDWDRFLGHAPKRPFEPIRSFRWRNYQDYGTGVAGDLYVHLFTGIHYVMDSNGPNRVMSTGGLYYWKDGRDVPDLMLGMYDYPDTKAHKAFHLSIRLNFEAGGGDGSGFRFIGTEGVLDLAVGLEEQRGALGEHIRLDPIAAGILRPQQRRRGAHEVPQRPLAAGARQLALPVSALVAAGALPERAGGRQVSGELAQTRGEPRIAGVPRRIEARREFLPTGAGRVRVADIEREQEPQPRRRSADLRPSLAREFQRALRCLARVPPASSVP